MSVSYSPRRQKSEMAQMERMQRSMETRTSPTVEQLLNDDAQWSSPATPKFGFHEEDHGHHFNQTKKSVLAKVRERTKRWKENLAKKKHNPDDNATPTWGVSLEEDDEQEGEPEYLGAPMYESEMAPEVCKETARQHPRADPVIPDNHRLGTKITTQDSEKHEEHEEHEEHNDPDNKHNDPDNKQKTITQTVTDKLAPACAMVTATLAPAYTTVSEATHQIVSKIHGQTDSTSPRSADNTHTGNVGSLSTGTVAGVGGARDQQWDKGVSVKEYLIHKLEPGEDERVLSQVITEVISPRKSTGSDNRDVGVAEKVKETVSSLLWTSNDSSSSSGYSKTTKPAKSASTNTPISTTNAYSAVAENEEEKNEGRVLQAN